MSKQLFLRGSSELLDGSSDDSLNLYVAEVSDMYSITDVDTHDPIELAVVFVNTDGNKAFKFSSTGHLFHSSLFAHDRTRLPSVSNLNNLIKIGIDSLISEYTTIPDGMKAISDQIYWHRGDQSVYLFSLFHLMESQLYDGDGEFVNGSKSDHSLDRLILSKLGASNEE